MSETGPCRLCGSERSEPRFAKIDLPVRRCLTCNAVYRSRVMTEDDVKELYVEDYFTKTWPGSLGRFFEDFNPDKHHKTRFLKKQLKHCESLVGGAGRLLDVGCANGVFVWLAGEAGWEAEGLEISSFAAARGREQFGVTISELPIEATPPEPRYDVITLWDTLEHMTHPKSVIHACHQRLKPGGYLVTLTPDCESLINLLVHATGAVAPKFASPYLEKLYHDDHLTYFTRDSLALNLIEHGFVIHWIESYDEHPADTETTGAARAALYALYPVSSLFQMKHEQLMWAEKPAQAVVAPALE